MIGYLIPEILLMIFSGSLGNWIKGALMAMSKFKAVMTAVRVWEKIVEVGRWTVSALRKMWKGIKSFFSSTFGKAFDEVLLFFDDFVKHGDDMAKIEKNTPTPAGVVDDVPHTGDRTPDVDGSGPRNDGPDGNKKHTPDADDTMRNLAYAEMVAEVRQSNMADEPMLKFQSDIYGIKRHFPIVKLFKFVSDGAGGSHVYMKASPLKYGGHKKKPTDVPNNVPGRSGAFRKAKRDAGIDLNQQPYKVDNVKMTDKYGNTIFDEKGEPIWTREYYYKNNKGQDIVIQDHSAGHSFGEGGLGDQGSHFNVRPAENTRTGTVPGTQDHYYFN